MNRYDEREQELLDKGCILICGFALYALAIAVIVQLFLSRSSTQQWIVELCITIALCFAILVNQFNAGVWSLTDTKRRKKQSLLGSSIASFFLTSFLFIKVFLVEKQAFSLSLIAKILLFAILGFVIPYSILLSFSKINDRQTRKINEELDD